MTFIIVLMLGSGDWISAKASSAHSQKNVNTFSFHSLRRTTFAVAKDLVLMPSVTATQKPHTRWGLYVAPLTGHELYRNFVISNVLIKIMYVPNAIYAKIFDRSFFAIIAHRILAPHSRVQQSE